MPKSPPNALASIRLVIARDDHIGEPIGAIFLEPGDGEAGVRRRVLDYLGRTARILTIEVAHDRIYVEVQGSPFAEESRRLAAAAGDLSRKGAPRNALQMYREALALDPLNGPALHQIGELLAGQKLYRDALSALRRAREVMGDSVDLLRGLAHVCIKTERVPTAIGYLERALELEPQNPTVRRELLSLGRKPPPYLPAKSPRAVRRQKHS